MNSASKYQFEHPAGQTLAPQIKKSLLRFFQENELRNLERSGGSITIRISLAKNRKLVDDSIVALDNSIIENLENSGGSEDHLNEILDKLVGKQLRLLGEALKLRFRSKATAKEMKQEIIRLFQHDVMWRQIADS